MFAADAVKVQGTSSEFRYTSGTGSRVTRVFCTTCGCPILGKNTRLPGYVTLTLGAMDKAEGLAVEVVVFERDKPHWDTLAPEVARYATQPDWTPKG